MAEPLNLSFQIAGLQTVGADLPVDEAAPSLDDVRKAVARLRCGKALGFCNISVELLKGGGESKTCSM